MCITQYLVDTILTACLTYKRPLFTEVILRCGLAIMPPMWAAKCRQNKQEAAMQSSSPFVFRRVGQAHVWTQISDDVMPSESSDSMHCSLY